MSLLIRLDEYVGGAAAAAMKSVRRFIGGDAPIDRPLAIRPGGLGDLVLATAALEELGVSPKSFDWLIELRSAPWARELSLSYACYDKLDNRLLRLLNRRRRLVINLEQLYGLSTAVASALVPRTGTLVGFNSNKGSSAFDMQVPYSEDEHELLAFQRLFGAALNVMGPSVRPRAREPHHSTNGQVLAIGGTAHPSRRIEDDDWLFLAALNPGLPVTIACGPSDETLAGRLAIRLPKCLGVAVGFDAVIQAMRNTERVVTVDGGLMHVASYLGVPTDAVFTSSNAEKWGPWSAGSRILKRDGLPCQPCARFGRIPPCTNGYECLSRNAWNLFPSAELTGFVRKHRV